MLQKESIETAIVLAKLIRKSGKQVMGIGRGTLVRSLLDESSNLCKHVDFNAEAIEAGDYTDLIDSIYNAHLEGDTFINDAGVMETEPMPHDGWMCNYNSAIAKSIFNNFDMIKNVVIPDVAALHSELVDLHNGLLPNLESELLIITPVVLPEFFLSTDFEELIDIHLHGDEKPVEDVGDFPISIFDENKVIIKVIESADKKFSSFNRGGSVGDISSLIKGYLHAGDKESYLAKQNLSSLGVLLSFFYSIYQKPFINTGLSSVDNKSWAHCNFHLVLCVIDSLVKLITEEQSQGLIFSKLTKDLERVYPRLSVDGTLPEVLYYPDNLATAKVEMSDKDFLVGAIVSKQSLGTLTFANIDENCKREVVEGHNKFINYVNSNSFRQVNTAFCEALDNVLGNFSANRKTPFFSSNTSVVSEFCPKDFIPKNSPITDDDLFKIAKDYVCEFMYAGTNASELFEVFYKDAEAEKDIEVIALGIINKLIVDFLMDQIEIYRG